MRILRLKNVLYFPHINSVGGIETYCYEMGLKYGKDYDLTLIFHNGDPGMLARISEVMRIIKYHPGDKIECDTFIFGYGHEILEFVEAKEIVQTFHADYINRHLNPCFDKRITRRYGVADNTTKGIREHFEWAKDIETMYNPYTVKKPRKVLRLVSATRLTPEKGYSRMVKFADGLEKAGIPFMWFVFTDDKHQTFPSDHVIKLPPTYDILDYIADADYLVQLSDTEGYSYSIVEALSVGTPVIVTEIPVAAEQGVINGKTGFILPFDMGNIPYKEIYKGVKRFKCAPRETHYDEILSPGKAGVIEENNGLVWIKCKKYYFDIELNDYQYVGDKQLVTMERAAKLENLGIAEIVW